MLDKLEYNEIIKLVSNYCKTYIGKVSVLNLKPCFDFEGVSRLLTETAEAMDISIRKSNIPICEIPNIDIWIKHLESNNVLSAKALIEIATVLKISRELKNYFFDDTSFSTNDFPILFDFFNSLYINKSVETTIFEKILDENTIADSASAKLSAIRRNRKKAEQAVRDKLDSIIHSSNYSKYLMEPIVTIRNDRFVIPLKQEYRNTIKGFIHDTSSSGSTVYLEPLSVFEINNEINNFKIEENIEIEKILHDLSILLYKYTSELKQNICIIGKLDVLSAKVSYSKSIDGINPILNTEKYIKDLEKVEKQYEEISQELNGQKAICLNEALEYLAKDIKLEYISLHTDHDENSMSAESIKNIINKMNTENIKIILIGKDDSIKNAEILANETNAKIYKLDTVLTGATDKNAYIDAANRNLEVLKSVLGDEK